MKHIALPACIVPLESTSSDNGLALYDAAICELFDEPSPFMIYDPMPFLKPFLPLVICSTDPSMALSVGKFRLFNFIVTPGIGLSIALCPPGTSVWKKCDPK